MEGIYLLWSKNTDGQYVYKVGRSGDIDKRVKNYPPNFEVLLQKPCDDSIEIEKIILNRFNTDTDIGIVKYEKGNEYYRSVKNVSDKLKSIISLILLEKKINKQFYKDVITFKRCLTNDDCELFIEFMAQRNKDGIDTIKKRFDVSCNHHWYYILLDNQIIGTFVLACGHCPNTTLDIFYIDIFEAERRKGFGSKVLQMIEREFFWDKKQMVVSEMFYTKNIEFLKKNGFILDRKLRDLFKCDYSEIKTVQLVFRWINTFCIEDFGDSKYYEDKIMTGTYNRWPSFIYTEEIDEFRKSVEEFLTLYNFTGSDSINTSIEKLKSIDGSDSHKDINIYINKLRQLIKKKTISSFFENEVKNITHFTVDYNKLLSSETIESLSVKLYVLYFALEEVKKYDKGYNELNVQISESWTHVITEHDGGFALLCGDEYLIKPIRYKYLRKKWENDFQLISTYLPYTHIARIDKIHIAGMDNIYQ